MFKGGASQTSSRRRRKALEKSKFSCNEQKFESPKDESTKGESDPEDESEQAWAHLQEQQKRILSLSLRLLRSKGETSGSYRKLAMLNASMKALQARNRKTEESVMSTNRRKLQTQDMLQGGVDSEGEFSIVVKRQKVISKAQDTQAHGIKEGTSQSLNLETHKR